jgi:uncharacterized membrane protein YfcA
MDYFLIVIILIIGGIIQSSCGFGAGLFCMSLLPFFLDYKIALPMMFLAGIVLNIRILFKTYKHIQWRIMIIPLAFSFIGRIFGQLAVNHLDSRYLQIVLGVMVTMTAIYQLFWREIFTIKNNFGTASAFGLTSGLMSGLASTGGPPLVIYLLNLKLEKYAYMATIQMLFLCGALFSVGLTSASGLIDQSVLLYALVAIASILAGSFIGLKLFDKLNRLKLVKLVNIFLVITGLSLIIKSLI